jgi:hypothetical protein
MDCATFRAQYPMNVRGAQLGSRAYQGWARHLSSCRVCADWFQGEECKRRGVDPARFPCVHLAYYTSSWLTGVEVSGVYPLAWQGGDGAPEVAIVYDPRYDEYGVHLYDKSVLGIRHCPWCGTALPPSRREEWFRRLAEMGFHDPVDQFIPEAFRSDAWYRK